MFQLELGRDIDVFLVGVSSVRVNDVQLRSMPGVEAGVVVVVLKQVGGGAGLRLPGRQHQVGGPGQDVVGRGLLPLPGFPPDSPVLPVQVDSLPPALLLSDTEAWERGRDEISSGDY